MFDFTRFSLQDMTDIGDAMQQLEFRAKNSDELTNMVTRYFFDHFVDFKTGEKSSALVRFFMTHDYNSLDAGLRGLADKILNGQPVPQEMKCLVLSATTGIEPEWNRVTASKEHRVLPLPSEEMLRKNLMVNQFIYQLGVDISHVLRPDPKVALELEGRIFNVYHIPDALGSPYIPAQDEFVVPFGIQSALGFGGMLPTGNLFALIIFSKTRIPRKTAELFKNIALNVRMAILPFVSEKIFVVDKNEITEEERLRSMIATQASLLEVYKRTSTEQTSRSMHIFSHVVRFVAKLTKKIWLYAALLSLSLSFLFIHRQTHNEFTLHLAAIPLEILLGALLIEKLLERKVRAERSTKLLYFKSYVFRSRLRNIYLANFQAIKFPAITIAKIKNASMEELKELRNDANHIEYKSLEAMETIIMAYLPAYHAFYSFMEWAIIHDIDSSFKNMFYILHFIEEVKIFKHNNPDTPFIYEAQKQRPLMKKVKKILAEGLFKFMDYLIELREKHPVLFYELLADYEELPETQQIMHERRNN